MGASLAELVVLAAAVWLLVRLLEPVRRRVERSILRRLAPHRAEILDADVIARPKKPKE